MSEKIKELHGLVLDGLITRLKTADPSTTDYSNAIKFLKDFPAIRPEEEARKQKQQEFMEGLELPFDPEKEDKTELPF